MSDLMPKIFELLGVKELEEFMIKGLQNRYRITNSGTLEFSESDGEWHVSKYKCITDLLNGTYEIIKPPFKPKNDEKYKCLWFHELGDDVVDNIYVWDGGSIDFLNFNIGNCYPLDYKFTEEEKEEFKNKLMGKYNAE